MGSARTGHGRSPGQKKVVKNVPLLLIDDEADNASINVKAKPGDKHKGIRIGDQRQDPKNARFVRKVRIRRVQPRHLPIFSSTRKPNRWSMARDLFPRSFIVSIKPPTNYIGPAKVFGLDGDPDAGIEASDGLPIVRNLPDDYLQAFRQNTNPTMIRRFLPDSLKTAVRLFILACAARRCQRAGKKAQLDARARHPRYVSVQKKVVAPVSNELRGLQRRIEFGDGKHNPALGDELENIWKTEFVPVTLALATKRASLFRGTT
ncbi:MAG: Z1 domain-containing protein [Rhodocyclaceae bacterium]|nr:Z1 domain-containing protein [Rhodocyclaceae bacterium]